MAASTASSPHSLATASGLLLGTTGAAMVVGALVGWAFGSWGIGLVALAASVYIVYLLEIVKLANPRVRRRRNGEAEDERLSA